MKLLKKAFAFTFIFMLSVSGLTGYQVNASEEPKHLDILFTHDLHSHLNSFQTIVDGTQQETGGFARLKTLINEHEKENTDTLILDGGDFSMGTLIQTVYDTEAAELRMLGYLGCDVTTLGNHEFDYGSDGLADMLNAAVSSGENLPRMVVCNVDWDAMKKAGLPKETGLCLWNLAGNKKVPPAHRANDTLLRDTVFSFRQTPKLRVYYSRLPEWSQGIREYMLLHLL